MVAEANHRIANNLSIISGLVRIHGAAICKEPRMMSGDDVRLILEEVGGRLDAVARLHRLLAAGRHGAPINVADFLREIVERAVSALSIGGATELQFDFGFGCCVPPGEGAGAWSHHRRIGDQRRQVRLILPALPVRIGAFVSKKPGRQHHDRHI